MASLSTSELKKSIAAILKGADLNALSSKKVRKKLEEQYDSDFCDRKEEIDGIVMAMVTAGENDKKSDSEDAESERENSDQGSSPQNSESEEEKEQSSKPVAKRKHEKETNDVKSESNSESEEEITTSKEDKRPPPKKSKPAAKKQPKKEVKNDERESGSDCEKSDDDVDDEALARKLQEEERNSRSRAVKKNFNKKESVKKSKSKGEGKPRKGSVYSRKCALSADLADVVGASEMARHDIVKKMWEVVRERNLFDPKNKRFAICDEQLQKVFGAKRVRMFGMMKYLKNHVKDQH